MTKILYIFFLSVLISSTSTAESSHPLRLWKSTKGTTIEAKFVEKSDQSIILISKLGKKITVPIDQLSQADQKYIQQITTPTHPIFIAYNLSGGIGYRVSTNIENRFLSKISKIENRRIFLFDGSPSSRFAASPQTTFSFLEKLPNVKKDLTLVILPSYGTVNIPKYRRAYQKKIKSYEKHAKKHDVTLLIIRPEATTTAVSYYTIPTDRTTKKEIKPKKCNATMTSFIDSLDAWKPIPVEKIKDALFNKDPNWIKLWDRPTRSYIIDAAIYTTITRKKPPLIEVKRLEEDQVKLDPRASNLTLFKIPDESLILATTVINELINKTPKNK